MSDNFEEHPALSALEHIRMLTEFIPGSICLSEYEFTTLIRGIHRAASEGIVGALEGPCDDADSESR